MRDIGVRIPGFEPAPTRRTSGSCAHLRDPPAWPSTCKSLRPCKAFAFTDTRTTVYAGRVVMIGWSWLLDRHLFTAAAVGLLVGRESGAQARPG